VIHVHLLNNNLVDSDGRTKLTGILNLASTDIRDFRVSEVQVKRGEPFKVGQ